MTQYTLLNYGPDVASARPGICVDGAVIDIQGAMAALGERGIDATSTTALLGAWDMAEPLLERIAAAASGLASVPLSSVTLLAPLLYPGANFNSGSNYWKHQQEMGGAPTDKATAQPYFFLKSPAHTMIGTGQEVRIPRVSRNLDWEAELAVVIGRPARNVAVEDALSYVAGYTICNDLSARDLLIREDWPRFRTDWFGAKNFEGSGPMGPWIVPARQIANPYDLKIDLWVNDDHMQDSRTDDMIFTIQEQIAYLSARLTLRPGDIVSTGTPAGVGGARGIFLKPGDTVRIRISEIGELINSIAREAPLDSHGKD